MMFSANMVSDVSKNGLLCNGKYGAVSGGGPTFYAPEKAEMIVHTPLDILRPDVGG